MDTRISLNKVVSRTIEAMYAKAEGGYASFPVRMNRHLTGLWAIIGQKVFFVDDNRRESDVNMETVIRALTTDPGAEKLMRRILARDMSSSKTIEVHQIQERELLRIVESDEFSKKLVGEAKNGKLNYRSFAIVNDGEPVRISGSDNEVSRNKELVVEIKSNFASIIAESSDPDTLIVYLCNLKSV